MKNGYSTSFDNLETQITKLESDFEDIITAAIFAKGAKISRLEVLRSKLERILESIAEENKESKELLRQSSKILKKETGQQVTLEQLANTSEHEAVAIKKLKASPEVKKQISYLMGRVNAAIKVLVD